MAVSLRDTVKISEFIDLSKQDEILPAFMTKVKSVRISTVDKIMAVKNDSLSDVDLLKGVKLVKNGYVCLAGLVVSGEWNLPDNCRGGVSVCIVDKRMKEEQEMERLKSQIKDLAFKEGVSLDFIDNIPFTSVEQANLYIRNFKTEIENAKTAKVNELLASGYKPGAGNEIKSTNKVDLSKLSEKEMIEMEMAGELDKALGNT